jgi:hypothetical protein
MDKTTKGRFQGVDSFRWFHVAIIHLLTRGCDQLSGTGVSPRALRAWPLAWPLPSGPLGRLRRLRAGPEDRFCEAVRNDLRVPLTLEGPTRTMRGIPACSL